MSSPLVSRRRCAIALLAVVLLSTGCSRAIDGVPVATPGQGGISAGAALLDTTCGQYVAMDPSDRREVVVAIGDAGNRLVALGPDAWVDLAAALCTFVDPGDRVADVLQGAVR
jgi:hypothetical protein